MPAGVNVGAGKPRLRARNAILARVHRDYGSEPTRGLHEQSVVYSERSRDHISDPVS